MKKKQMCRFQLICVKKVSKVMFPFCKITYDKYYAVRKNFLYMINARIIHICPLHNIHAPNI